jgi:pimeloyl-ACP methyl ester carboxylesterase
MAGPSNSSSPAPPTASHGGPHALATAALLPERCLGAATIAGVAPYAAEGLDRLGGMGAENIEEFAAAVAGDPALSAYLEKEAAGLATVEPAEVAAALGDLVSDVDKTRSPASSPPTSLSLLLNEFEAVVAGLR